MEDVDRVFKNYKEIYKNLNGTIQTLSDKSQIKVNIPKIDYDNHQT